MPNIFVLVRRISCNFLSRRPSRIRTYLVNMHGTDFHSILLLQNRRHFEMISFSEFIITWLHLCAKLYQGDQQGVQNFPSLFIFPKFRTNIFLPFPSYFSPPFTYEFFFLFFLFYNQALKIFRSNFIHLFEREKIIFL